MSNKEQVTTFDINNEINSFQNEMMTKMEKKLKEKFNELKNRKIISHQKIMEMIIKLAEKDKISATDVDAIKTSINLIFELDEITLNETENNLKSMMNDLVHNTSCYFGGVTKILLQNCKKE